ncbi:acetyl-CoA synthetase-like protein, partial [Aureobasidium melanogenum]
MTDRQFKHSYAPFVISKMIVKSLSFVFVLLDVVKGYRAEKQHNRQSMTFPPSRSSSQAQYVQTSGKDLVLGFVFSSLFVDVITFVNIFIFPHTFLVFFPNDSLIFRRTGIPVSAFERPLSDCIPLQLIKPHLISQNFASRVLRNGLLEAEVQSCRLVFCELVLAVFCQSSHDSKLLVVERYTSFEHHMRNRQFFHIRGVKTKNTNVRNEFVRQQTSFDFCGRDLPAAVFDHVFLAIGDVEFVVVGEVGYVACAQPAVAKRVERFGGVVVHAFGLSGCDVFAVGVGDPDIVLRRRRPTEPDSSISGNRNVVIQPASVMPFILHFSRHGSTTTPDEPEEREEAQQSLSAMNESIDQSERGGKAFFATPSCRARLSVTRLRCDLAAILGNPVVPLVDMRTATVSLAREIGERVPDTSRRTGFFIYPNDDIANIEETFRGLRDRSEGGSRREDKLGLRDLEVVTELTCLVRGVSPCKNTPCHDDGQENHRVHYLKRIS